MDRIGKLSTQTIANEADTAVHEQYPDVYSQIKGAFKCNKVSDAVTKSVGVVQTALLATLAIILPKMQGLTSTPLGKTKEGVNSYLEAVIKSGVATDAHREMLYVLGNTNTGKTSLAETYKAFFEKPDKTPDSMLTQDHPELLKTRIAEVHKDAILPQILSGTLQTEKIEEHITLVRFENTPGEEGFSGGEMAKCLLKIIDFGGHQVITIFVTVFSQFS